MNTLGNLLAEPRAALLFIDFENGDILHLQGETQILWQADIDRGGEGRNVTGDLICVAPGASRKLCPGVGAIWNTPRPR